MAAVEGGGVFLNSFQACESAHRDVCVLFNCSILQARRA